MTTEILTGQKSFFQLKDEWSALLQRSEINHIFMTPQFLAVWWQNLGHGELKIITFYDTQKRLIGIAPLFLDKDDKGKKCLSAIGCTTVTDYFDIVVDQAHKKEVYAAFVNVLKSNQIPWEALSLISIPNASPTLKVFVDLGKKAGWKIEQKQQDVCPIIALSKSWEEYLVKIGKKQRHEVRRKWERLERETHPKFRLIEAESETAKNIDEFIQLHQRSSIDKKNFWDDKHIAFFHDFGIEAAKYKWLKLYFLEIDGEQVASMLVFDYDNQFFLYNSGFAADKYKQFSVGNVLTSYTIKQAIELGKKRYDFLRGDEEYKLRFGAVPEPIFDLTISRI